MGRLGRAGLAAILGGAVALLATAGVQAAVQPAKARPDGLKLERVILFYRHGLRSPLDGEAAAAEFARQAWPSWSTPQSHMTPHGREGMRLLGAYDRSWLAAQGLLPAQGCPQPGQVSIWANTEERTIVSGEELAEGLAPGCELPVDHLEAGKKDPLFEPGAAGVLTFDGEAAVRSIMSETGGPDALIAPHKAEIATLETILGCGPGDPPPRCDLAAIPGVLRPSAGGHGIVLKGPIDITSGTAEVFILQYLEGMPLAQVGWGRATPARLSQISRLHALLFDIHARPRYVAEATAGPLARHIRDLLEARTPATLDLIVGHDNNISALTSLIGAHFQMDGYGYDDPPVGGGVGLEVLRDPRTGVRYVRVFYQAQTPDQLRNLTPLSLARPPASKALTVPGCRSGKAGLCELSTFEALLNPGLKPELGRNP
jgi:4-phytase/acid phosphatase